VELFQVISNSPKRTQEVGRKIGELAQPGDLILLVGQLGAGKTCLVQGIALGLGIKDYVSSPSFVLVREHQGGLPLYHIDLYRLDRLEESADLGLDDYVFGRGVCVVEWADKALELFPAENLLIEIKFISATKRALLFRPSGSRYMDLAEQLKTVLVGQ